MPSLAQRRGLARRSMAEITTKPTVAVTHKIYKLKEPETFLSFFTVEGDIHDGGDQCRIKRIVRKSDGKEFVVKVQKKTRIRGSNEALFRRMTERMLNMPDNENVINIAACYEDDRFFYTLMDSCRGGDLFDFFQMLASDDMPPDELNRELQIVMREMLLSLKHLHNQGLVHKDVKLENLVFRDQGGMGLGRSRSRSASPASSPKRGSVAPKSPSSPKVLKLIDFDFTEEWEPSSPKSQSILGTDGYIAPECYLGDVCPKSDIFSAGVILYLLVTGRFPYDDELFDDKPGENVTGHWKMQDIYDKLNRAKVRWSSSAWARLPLARDMCQKLMAFDVMKRYDADQALADPWLDGVKTSCEQLSTAPSTPMSRS